MADPPDAVFVEKDIMEEGGGGMIKMHNIYPCPAPEPLHPYGSVRLPASSLNIIS